VERLCHETHQQRFLLDLREGRADNEELRRQLLDRPRLERFIGVIYRPDTERMSHYSDSLLSKQFDAYVWFDETQAVSRI
jgi:erythromycin esterase-like protein